MLVFVWMCVMARALSPSTAQLARWSVTAYQAEMESLCERAGPPVKPAFVPPPRKIYASLSAFAR